MQYYDYKNYFIKKFLASCCARPELVEGFSLSVRGYPSTSSGRARGKNQKLIWLLKNLKKGDCLAMSKRSNIEISVSGHIDKALRQLKKKIEREGIVRDMKRTVYFESTTQKRRKRLVRAIKQNMMRMITAGTAPKD